MPAKAMNRLEHSPIFSPTWLTTVMNLLVRHGNPLYSYHMNNVKRDISSVETSFEPS